jgi:alpha-galactosidase
VSDRPLILSAAGTSLVLDIGGPHLPVVHHWGVPVGPDHSDDLLLAADVGIPSGALDRALVVPLLPTEADGWLGRPGISANRDGQWAFPRLRLTGPPEVERRDTGGSVRVTAADVDAGLEVASELVLDRFGVLRMRHTATNTGTGIWSVDGLLCLMPVPAEATELLDLAGRWCRESVPQRTPFAEGTRTREGRRGRTGHDTPLLMVAGTPGFGFRSGEVWAVHVAWSGNHVHLAQRHPEYQALLGGGELLTSGEVRLGSGQRYQTPWVYFVHSSSGLDGLSEALHSHLRARPEHPKTPRPVTLNVWEAVYFDHRLDRLTALADRAARIGVERFVLDDGWFPHRRDDHAGLGDWYVDPAVWPDGLGPLVDHVRGRGMQFGLWFEPQGINLDSDIARAHPDWVLGAPGRMPIASRYQQLLDIARPEAWAYLLERMDSLVTEYAIDYIKWDHNRDTVEAVHDGTPAVHGQTVALYRLIDELRRRHPSLEIESCSSGGARVDLGILARTDRIWASDTNDPLERQATQRWTGLLVPPEMVGSHVGPTVSHTTHRATNLAFRCATALFGHAGIEWDITECTEPELDALARWIGGYQRLRGLVHHGVTVRVDHPDPSVLLHGVVAHDCGHALFGFAQLTTSGSVYPPRLRLPGLDQDSRYVVRPLPELPVPGSTARETPPWVRRGEIILSGAELAGFGLVCPVLRPQDAFVLELTRIAG